MLIDIHKDARHTKVLLDFVDYCNQNPNLRFWQALLNWSGQKFILFSTIAPKGSVYKEGVLVDTYYFEGKNK